MKFLLFNIVLLFPLGLVAQSVDFEKLDTASGLPAGWFGSKKKVYVDSLVKHGGHYAYALSGKDAFTSAEFPIECESPSLSVAGWVKTEELVGQGKISVIIFSADDTPDTGTCLIERNFRVQAGRDTEWSRFLISDIPLCREAEKLQLGIFKNGTGKLWLDDIEFVYSVDRFARSETENEIQYAAASDHEFDGGSGFTDAQAKESDIENLELLGRVWGMMKYYHPAVRAGKVNWDYELFRILPEVYNADKRTRNAAILRWIDRFGEFDVDTAQPVEDELNWIYDVKLLGRALSSRLKEVAKARRTGFSYYASSYYDVGNIAAKNESAYENMDIGDAGIKLLAVYRLWNFLEYFYPYKELSEEWGSALENSLVDMVDSETMTDYYFALMKIMSAINDSHGGIGGCQEAFYESYGDHAAFFMSRYAEGKFIVRYTFGDHADNLRVGDAIIAINGLPVADFIESKRIYTSSSNFDKLTGNVAANISKGADPIIYTIDRDGVVMEQKVDVFPVDVYMSEMRESRLPGPKQGKSIAAADRKPLEILADSIVYVKAVISSELLDSVETHYSKYPKFIIDMRGYPQSNEFFSFISNFIPGMEMSAKFIIPDVMTPGKFNVTDGDYFGSGKNVRDYEIVVLVDSSTMSAAEYCTMILQQAPDVTVLGSMTAGADGNVTMFGLPGNMQSVFTGIGILYPDGGQTQRIGVRIDEEVRPTINGIRQGRDEVLEKALEIIKARD